jgi:hypothetical protein
MDAGMPVPGFDARRATSRIRGNAATNRFTEGMVLARHDLGMTASFSAQVASLLAVGLVFRCTRAEHAALLTEVAIS